MTGPDAAPRPRIPDLALRDLAAAADAPPVPLRVPRHAAVLVLLDAAPDARDAAFLDALAAHAPALRDWDGRVLVIVRDAESAAARALRGASRPFPVLLEAAGAVAAAADVRAPALLVVDQWGEVHVRRSVTAEEAWLAPDEIEKWLRFLAIRCAG